MNKKYKYESKNDNDATKPMIKASARQVKIVRNIGMALISIIGPNTRNASTLLVGKICA